MLHRLPLLPSLVVLPLLLAAAPVGAQGINRCLGPDGTMIFTDRGCAAFGAVPAAAPAGAGGNAPAMMGLDGAVGGFAIRGCARSPDALLNGVRDALQAHDVNRLANYYHWSGTGAGAAVHLMDRLEAIANRPLAGVELSFPEERAWFAPPDDMVASVGEARTPPTASAGIDPRAQAGPGFMASLQRAPVEIVDVVPVPLEDAAALDAPLSRSVGDPAFSPPEGGRSVGDPAFSPPPPPRPVGLRVLQASGFGDPGSVDEDFGLRRNAGCWWIQF